MRFTLGPYPIILYRRLSAHAAFVTQIAWNFWRIILTIIFIVWNSTYLFDCEILFTNLNYSLLYSIFFVSWKLQLHMMLSGYKCAHMQNIWGGFHILCAHDVHILILFVLSDCAQSQMHLSICNVSDALVKRRVRVTCNNIVSLI